MGSLAGTFDTYLLESDSITGPFKLITYMEAFGPQAYFAHLPSKFLQADARTGSVRACLSYSANYAPGHMPNPKGSGYHWNLLEVRLTGRRQRASLHGRAGRGDLGAGGADGGAEPRDR